MTEQYREFIDAGVQILAVVHGSEETARDYLQRHGIPFPCLVDTSHEVYDLYQVESKAISLGQRPGLFVIDRDASTDEDKAVSSGVVHRFRLDLDVWHSKAGA